VVEDLILSVVEDHTFGPTQQM